MKARERNKLLGLIRREGMTLVPLVLCSNDRGVAKIQIDLAKAAASRTSARRRRIATGAVRRPASAARASRRPPAPR